jgi:hypothetical protein
VSHAPSRLIDVSSATQVPRLCYSTEGKTGGSKYVTLSHCWGSLQMTKLTASTHDELVKGINLQTLPKSFQGAIKFTRRLRTAFGVYYLRIDALCILQDSPDDWRHEGSLMSDIYAKAWCNLAAAKGKDGGSGLFSQRDQIRSTSVLAIDSESNTITSYVVFPDSVWDPVAKSHCRNNVNSPIWTSAIGLLQLLQLLYLPS